MATYLQLVQKAVRKSGATVEEPSTLISGTSALVDLIAEWVAEAWKHIQMERMGLEWRRDRDLTLSLVASTDEYSLPATLESINYRSLTCHLSDENETPVTFQTYDYWRRWVDRVDRSTGKPQYFTISPDNKLIVWPVPDNTYTIRYEGVKVIDELSTDADVPAGLDAIYHDAIVWQALMYYAMHFEDGTKLQEAQAMFRPYKKYFEERYMPMPTVDTTALYSLYGYNHV